jgi:hypothetical protein
MRLFSKILGIGAAIAAYSFWRNARRAAVREPGEDPDVADMIAGIAEVDPQPLSQISGEGIDPDATAAAHDEIPDQRERLPRHGKNIL